MIDCHLHSEFSIDSGGDLIDYCKRALNIGLTGIGFSEHIDFDPRDNGFGFYSDLIFGLNLNILKTIYMKQLSILKGVEITYQPQYMDKISSFLNETILDYVIGSIHFVDDWNISSSALEETIRFRKISQKASYQRYFIELRELVKSDFFEILGHFDIITRYGFLEYGNYNPIDYMEIIEEILKILINNGKILEINSSGLRNNPKTIYPHPEILKRYADLGGDTVVLSSDAHSPEFTGFEFKRLKQIALNSGIKYEAVFRQRKVIKKNPL
ncbi:histidinol-phosphatase HisJ family protein [Candidatus Dependentiae bacterium]|nr:histidinol-phosphatase HisJ family protein [Candidatus Dependentiae bacterium]